MCGIGGYVAFPAANPKSLESLRLAIAHRGPDDVGAWSEDDTGLVHCRLSIIDLSAAGHQPMVSHCGRFVLVFNGEIYNFLELRKQLESEGQAFHGGSDSEVLLAAFQRWGDRCVDRLNGMWAFAIWDRQRKRLFASRDRLGKKPFYYVLRGHGLAFSSEIKGLLAAGYIDARPDLQSLADFAAERVSDHGERTFFAGVKQILPGHAMTWESGRLSFQHYWNVAAHAIAAGRPAPAAEEVLHLLNDAIRLRLRSDVPVGTLLSGGLDSSAVTCLAARGGHDELVALCTIDPDYPVKEAEGVQHVLAANPNVRLIEDKPHLENFLEDLPACLWHQEEPFADASMVAHFRLMRMARKAGIKVLLTGQGADEIFAGYPGFLIIHLSGLIRSGHLSEAARFAKNLLRSGQGNNLSQLPGYLLPNALRQLLRTRRAQRSVDWLVPEARCVSNTVASGFANPKNDAVVSAQMDCLQARTLPGFLHYEDRNSMAHGVETRLPFLDYRIVECMISVTGADKLSQAQTKAILRKTVEASVPAAIINRLTKEGYPAPLGRWLQTAPTGTWDTWIRAVRACPMIRFDRWASHHTALKAGNARSVAPTWRGLVIALWYERFCLAKVR